VRVGRHVLAAVWRDQPPRSMVGHAGHRFSRLVRVHRLRDVGGLSERALSLRTISLADVLARAFRLVAAQLVRSEARVVARCTPLLAYVSHHRRPARLSPHLLLLS